MRIIKIFFPPHYRAVTPAGTNSAILMDNLQIPMHQATLLMLLKAVPHCGTKCLPVEFPTEHTRLRSGAIEINAKLLSDISTTRCGVVGRILLTVEMLQRWNLTPLRISYSRLTTTHWRRGLQLLKEEMYNGYRHHCSRYLPARNSWRLSRRYTSQLHDDDGTADKGTAIISCRYVGVRR